MTLACLRSHRGSSWWAKSRGHRRPTTRRQPIIINPSRPYVLREWIVSSLPILSFWILEEPSICPDEGGWSGMILPCWASLVFFSSIQHAYPWSLAATTLQPASHPGKFINLLKSGEDDFNFDVITVQEFICYVTEVLWSRSDTTTAPPKGDRRVVVAPRTHRKIKNQEEAGQPGAIIIRALSLISTILIYF